MQSAPRVELTLALPCYNNNEVVLAVLREAIGFLDQLGNTWEIIVVDDCSPDNTATLVAEVAAKDPRVHLISHEATRLYSGACETILRRSRGRYLAIMDPDGQYSVADVPAFLSKLRRGASLVFGWRQQRDELWTAKLASGVFNLLGQFWLGFPLHDLNVGLRMFDRKLIAAASIQHHIDMVNPELFVRARKASLIIDEVPVTHLPGKKRKSRHSWWQIVRYLSKLSRELNELTIIHAASKHDDTRPKAA